MKENKVNLSMSAIDTYVATNLPDSDEVKMRNKEYINWGSDNKYPSYLWDLYTNAATLQSIINGTSDFICGNDVIINVERFKSKVNNNGETILDIVRKITMDKLIFGGYALQIIRAYDGSVSELYALDLMKLRTDEKAEMFYYSNDWTVWSPKVIKLPKFDPNKVQSSSVFYNKGSITRGVYPIPVYGAAIISCELEKAINEFHLNSINNGFMSSAIINFNNGQPNDEQKAEIEKLINEKFSGYQNASRILISYNDSDENKTTIERLDGDDFDSKYEALSTRTREQIFTAFRANSVLFGINYSSGFNENEFNEAFKLYNRTVVYPIQKEIVNSFDKIFNVDGSITIIPFNLTPKGEAENETKVE